MELKRVFDLLEWQRRKYNIKDALNMKVGGDWYCYSTQDFIDIVNKVSMGLLQLGLSPGDKVGIISANRPEWNFIDFGAQQVGLVTVPIYPTISEDDYHYIFGHSDAKAVFVGDAEIYRKALAAQKGTGVTELFSFDELPGCRHWREVEALGAGQPMADLEARKARVKPDDLLSIIYTSGTTGRPKGVMLTHDNLIFNTIQSHSRVPSDIPRGNFRALSFLPLCHIAERGVVYLDIYMGASIYYAESLEKVPENIKEVKPHFFFTVPRLLEKVYDKIIAKGNEQRGVVKDLFFWAVNLGLGYEPNEDKGFLYDLQLEAANYLIFSKWREAMGGHLKVILVGAAPLQPRLARVFWAAGIKVVEAYGLTETSPVISASIGTKRDIRIGYAGAIQDGVEVRIAEDGEILCRGRNVMKGYYKNPEATAEVLSPEGWFHTGDIGEIAEGRYLKITDRKKEMFKTSGGKYVAPGYMENVFKGSIFIEQMAVVGANQKFPAALIVPSFEVLEAWCKQEGIAAASPEAMVRHPKVLAHYQAEIDQYNRQFGKWEQIKKFALLPQPWGVETDELTPTMKLKRRVIDQKYAAAIDSMYANPE
jgi:long-chain acyl-CoA synthetase